MNVRTVLQVATLAVLATINLTNPEQAVTLSTQTSVGSILVEPASGFQTTESGGNDSFNIRLGSRPTSAVQINLRSSNVNEGTISPSRVVIGPGEWSTAQTVRITGVDDSRVDGDVHYLVITDPAHSNDPAYDGVDPQDVEVTNLDNDTNQIPFANDDSDITEEGTAVNTNILANDQGLGDPPLSLTVINNPAHGMANVQENRQIRYTPQPNFNGTDAYRYQVCDRDNECSSASVALLIEPINNPPAINNDYAETLEDNPIDVNLLTNDGDLDGDLLTVIEVSPPEHGTADLINSSTAHYQPGTNFTGQDTFNYQVTDGQGGIGTAQVIVEVFPVNDTPTAVGDDYSINQNTVLQVSVQQGVLANDSDPEGDHLTAMPVFRPSHGSLDFNPDGSFVYTPDPLFSGLDEFSYRASDVSLSSNTATASISVADQQLPNVSWVLPVSNEQIYYARSGVISLQVNAPDNIGIASVRFLRWDSIGLQYIDIGTSTISPYQVTLDISTLNLEWNQVFAIAYDSSGNASPRQSIWIFRTLDSAFPLFLPWVSR